MAYENEYRARAKRMRGRIRSVNGIFYDYEFITTDNLEAMLKAADHCPSCGCLMELRFDRYESRSVTIDRIIPRLGYVEENVRMICWGCNQIKNNYTVDQLQNVVDYINKQSPDVRAIEDKYFTPETKEVAPCK